MEDEDATNAATQRLLRGEHQHQHVCNLTSGLGCLDALWRSLGDSKPAHAAAVVPTACILVPETISKETYYAWLSVCVAVLLCAAVLLLAESAGRSGFGKGFTPQVAPLSSLLGKLQARQAALSAK
jgi:hypothetical protein